jgi:antitoxin VapB
LARNCNRFFKYHREGTPIFNPRRCNLVDKRKAKLFRNGGSQAVRLPSEFRFEGDEVYISRDEATGDVILSSQPRRDGWRAFVAWRDARDIAADDVEDYVAERPMNRPVCGHEVFEDEA